MWKAIEDMVENGRSEGRQEGRQETLRSLINNWLEKGKTVLEIAELLGRSEEEVRALM